MSDEKHEPDEQAPKTNEVDEADLGAVSGGFNPQPEPPGIPARVARETNPLKSPLLDGSIASNPQKR